MAFTLTELDIIIAKISRHLPSDECSGVYLRKRENSQVAKDAASAGVNELWASNSNSSDMFNTPGTSDYTPRGAAAASPPMNQSSSSGGNCGQVSSSDLNQVPRHGSISSSAGRRSTDCENCIHLQNQMLRFKEQVVVIRGNLGNRMAALENQLKEAQEKEKLAHERLQKVEEENKILRRQKSENEKFSQEVKQEMKQLFEVQLNEKTKELEKLEQKLLATETKLQNMAKQPEANPKQVNGSVGDGKYFETSAIQDENFTVHTVEADSDADAPQIPVRPASTWRSSIVHTGNTPVQVKRSDVTQRLSNDDYDIVHEDDKDVFFDSRQSLTFANQTEYQNFADSVNGPSRTRKLEYSPCSLPLLDDPPGHSGNSNTSVCPPERPLHKYPKWEEQVYQIIKKNGFNRNIGIDRTGIKFSCGMSVVCDDIDKSFDDKSQVMPLVYASVAGTAFQLTDHRGELESKLSAYTSMAAATTEAASTSSKTSKSGETETEKGTTLNRSDSPTQQVVQNLTGFKLIGDDWNSAQAEVEEDADYCIPPDAIPEDIEDRDYIKESDLEMILSKSSTMNSFDNQNSANAEVLSGNLQLVIEEVPSTSVTSHTTDHKTALLTRSNFTVSTPNRTFTFPLENIKSAQPLQQGNGRLFKVVFFDDYSVMVCCDSSKSCEQWVCEINKVLLQKPLRGQDVSDTATIMKSWLCQIQNGRKVDVWAVLSDNQLHLYASKKDKRPSYSVNLIGANLFEYAINENQTTDSGDHSLLTSDNRFSDRSSSGTDGLISATRDLTGFMLVIAAKDSAPLFIVSRTREELIEWKYQCELSTGGGITSSGTLFEQAISQLMRNPSESQLWCSPPFAYEHSNREEKFDPLTTLSSQAEIDNAEKMWKLFLRCLKWKYDTRNNLQAASSDGYFVSQAQTAFQICLPESSLHNEACCQLIRLCNTKDFLIYSVTAFQLLSLFVALTHPKTAYLWLLKQFLGRVASTKTVEGKYALYCLRMLGRPRPAASHKRRYPPSSLEVQSITQHNPHDVTQPMAVPVNLPDGATHYAGCDGIMTVDQFLHQLCLSLDIREPAISGYALYVSSPMSITPHHAVQQPSGSYVEYRLAPHLIVADVISRYEMIAKSHLAAQGLTPTPTDTLMRFHLKNRFSWRLLQQGETERERLFSVYNYAAQVANSLVPVSRDLANYLTGLMTFIELGEFNNHVSKHTVGIKIMEIIKQYYPKVYLQSLDNAALNLLCFTIQSYWSDVTSARAAPQDCIRTYLTSVRSWKFHDCKFVQLTRSREKDVALLAIGEVGVALLRLASFEVIFCYSIPYLISFGSRKNKLHLAFSIDGNVKRYELMGTYSQVYEAAVSIAEYVNELSWLRRHVGEYARSSDFSLTNPNAAHLASGSDAAGSKQDSLMVLRC